MMNRARKFVSILTVLWLAAAIAPVSAEVILGQQDWDPPSPSAGWTNLYGQTVLSTPSTGGNTGGWMQVTFPYTAQPLGTSWYDVVYMPATNLFAGAWNTNAWIQFDFWASNVSPASVQVQFQATNNANVWGYELPVPGTGVWSTMTAPLMNWEDWQYFGADEAQFLADLAAIDWIGIYIFRTTDQEQIYGVDNFMLAVPEPAEWMLLAMVAAVTISAFRRKRVFSS